MLVGPDGPVEASLDARLAAFDPEHAYVVFGLSRNDVVDERGQPLESIEVSVNRPGPCGCPAPGAASPLRLGVGESCPVPTFAATFDPSNALESSATRRRVMTAVRLLRSGACFEEPDEPFTERPELISPGPDLEPAQASALGPFGAVSSFSEKMALRIEPDGRRISARSLPFRGPVLAALALPNDSTLVASWDTLGPAFTRFDRFTKELESAPVPLLPSHGADRLRPAWMKLLDDGRILIAGRQESERGHLFVGTGGHALLAECDLIDHELLCRPALRPRLFDGWYVVDGAALGGEYLAVSNIGEVSVGGGSELREFAMGGPAYSGVSAHAFGSKWIVCTLDERLAPQVRVGDAGVGLGQPVYRHPYGQCAGFAASEDGRAVDVLFTTGELVRVSRQGTIEGPRLIHGHVPGIFQLLAESHGRGLIVDVSSNLWIRTASAATAKITYGALDPREAGQVAVEILRVEEEALVFWTNPNRVSSVALDTGVLRERPDLVLPFNVHAGLVFDSARREIVGSSDAEGPAFLFRLPVDGGDVRRIELPSELHPPDSMTEVSPGVIVAAGSDWQLLRVEGDFLTAIQPLWDDPGTPEIESRVESEHCRLGHVLAGSRTGDGLTWRAVDSAGGVAFATGCIASLVQIVAFGPAPYARRLMLRPELQISDEVGRAEAAGFLALSARTPGRVILGAAQESAFLRDTPHAIVATFGSASPDPGRLDDLASAAAKTSPGADALGDTPGGPLSIWGRDGAIRIAFMGLDRAPSGGWVGAFVPGATGFRESLPITSARPIRDRLVVATHQGRTFLSPR
ncbi:MAG: hypothetical protein HYV07_31230 [Deltaproteobacteria bacterium]|nr:hypothetical protein [Deltaproteobacteria bacterium]